MDHALAASADQDEVAKARRDLSRRRAEERDSTRCNPRHYVADKSPKSELNRRGARPTESASSPPSRDRQLSPAPSLHRQGAH